MSSFSLLFTSTLLHLLSSLARFWVAHTNKGPSPACIGWTSPSQVSFSPKYTVINLQVSFSSFHQRSNIILRYSGPDPIARHHKHLTLSPPSSQPDNILFLRNIIALLGLLCLSVQAANFTVNIYRGTSPCGAADLADVREGAYKAHSTACFQNGAGNFYMVNSGKYSLRRTS
jgi:hypothetical protein